MPTSRNAVRYALVVLVVVACDHGATGPGTTPTPTFVRLQSDLGDYIGLGGTYDYDQTNALINIEATGGHLAVGINGEQSWGADFMSPLANAYLERGTYSGLARYPLNDPVKGGIAWVGGGRSCTTVSGSFTVDSVRYDGTALRAIDLRFEQHCEGAMPALHGSIHWDAADTTHPPPPVNPMPTGLWAPAPGAVPPSGNYIYLESEAADFVGGGTTYTYTPTSTPPAQVAVRGFDGLVTVTITVDTAQWWYGYFQTMVPLTHLQTGYYGSLNRYGHNLARGGLYWWGEFRACQILTGWFAVDNIAYDGDSPTVLDLRFEQHCEGRAAALHGAIHWGR